MQLVLNLKNAVIGTAILATGYYGYRSLYADIQEKDVGELIRAHRDSQPARQLLIKRRILAIYRSGRDYEEVGRALDAASPVTQALAIEILRGKGEGRAVPRLIEMIHDTASADIVKEELANALGALGATDAIPRLIELTDIHEPQPVRAAAHNALKSLTGAGGEMKLSEATRQHWTLLWRGHRQRIQTR